MAQNRSIGRRREGSGRRVSVAREIGEALIVLPQTYRPPLWEDLALP